MGRRRQIKTLQLVLLCSLSSARRQVSLSFFSILNRLTGLLLLPLYAPSKFRHAGTFSQLIIAFIWHTSLLFAFLDASTRFTWHTFFFFIFMLLQFLFSTLLLQSFLFTLCEPFSCAAALTCRFTPWDLFIHPKLPYIVWVKCLFVHLPNQCLRWPLIPSSCDSTANGSSFIPQLCFFSGCLIAFEISAWMSSSSSSSVCCIRGT